MSLQMAAKTKSNPKSKLNQFLKQWELQSMIWPGVIFLIIFSVIPMLGILVAFENYSIAKGMLGFFTSHWVGFKYFKQFFTDENFLLVLRNTLAISLLRMFISFPVPIIFALLLNEVMSQRFKRMVQTISYLPYFISWVVYSGLVIDFLSADGLINTILTKTGMIKDPVYFLSAPGYFWSVLIASGILKSLGYSSIIYIAAIASIDQEMYESAIIDGAGRLRIMWSITLPSISNTIVIMFLLQISSMLYSNFDQVWMLQNNLNVPTSEVIDTYVYKLGIQKMRYSYATAVGLFQSLVGLLLLYSGNFLARKVGDKGLF